MRRFARLVFLLLPIALTGCSHRRSAPPLPPQAKAPAIPSPQQSTDASKEPAVQTTTPPPVATVEPESKPEPPKTTVKPKHSTGTKTRRVKTPAPKPAASETPAPVAAAPQKAPAATQQASNEAPNLGSPIGQLTSGDGGNSAQKHREASQLIEATSQKLSAIRHSLSDQQQETATQIRIFLKQAREALSAEDLDGAVNLANKAKVLLAELSK